MEASTSSAVRVVCLSDTHLAHCRGEGPEVPGGDVLVHAGDATLRGTQAELVAFAAWFSELPHPRKVFVPGNHDFLFESDPGLGQAILGPGVDVLIDRGLGVAGLRVWGSPWTPEFFDWAFMLPAGPAMRRVWSACPAGVDLLITHGPPAGIGSRTVRGADAGCGELLDEIERRIRPRLHVFGHIHEGYGRVARGGTTFVNASVVDHRYRRVNDPIVVDLRPRGEP